MRIVGREDYPDAVRWFSEVVRNSENPWRIRKRRPRENYETSARSFSRPTWYTRHEKAPRSRPRPLGSLPLHRRRNSNTVRNHVAVQSKVSRTRLDLNENVRTFDRSRASTRMACSKRKRLERDSEVRELACFLRRVDAISPDPEALRLTPFSAPAQRVPSLLGT